jgi:dTDP-glucose 4,6-dehydratase
MKVLITGSEGFIGRHLRDELEQRGHHVVGVDRSTNGRSCEHDLRRSIRLLLQHHKPDMVVHLAAHVGRLFGEDDMTAAVADNALATTLLARDCGELEIRLAYASTSEVYGDRGEQVCAEADALSVLPHNLYGLSKRWGEEACHLYTEDPVIFRFSMPYGPGVPPGRGRRALDTMLWQAHHQLPITVHRGAERSWCWVGDTVNGVAAVLESGLGGAWNVGRDDRPLSMLELAERACALAGASRDLIEVIDPPARQTVVKRLSTEKVRSLGWAPQVELDEGLERVFEWVKNFDAQGLWVPAREAA